MTKFAKSLAALALAALVPASAFAAAPETQGYWTGEIDARIVGDGLAKKLKASASLTSTDKGAVFAMSSRGKPMCAAVYDPASAIADMAFVGTDCANLHSFSLAPAANGGVTASFTAAKTNVVVEMKREHDGSGGGAASTMPSSPMDLRGVALEGDAGSIMEAVTGLIEPRDPENPWTEEVIEGVTLYSFVSPRIGYSSTNQEERFLVLMPAHDPALEPYGLVRWWNPQEGGEPTLASLQEGLIAKYGEPSRRYSPGKTRSGEDVDRGMVWSYAPDGTKLDAAAAEKCTRQKPEGDRARAAIYKQVWNFDASLRKIEMPVRPGCGMQLVVNYPMQMPQDPVDVASFTVFDPQRLGGSLWFAQKAAAEAQIAEMREVVAHENAQQAERDAVKPAL